MFVFVCFTWSVALQQDADSDTKHWSGTCIHTSCSSWGDSGIRTAKILACNQANYGGKWTPQSAARCSNFHVSHLALFFLHGLQHLQHFNPTSSLFPGGCLRQDKAKRGLMIKRYAQVYLVYTSIGRGENIVKNQCTRGSHRLTHALSPQNKKWHVCVIMRISRNRSVLFEERSNIRRTEDAYW